MRKILAKCILLAAIMPLYRLVNAQSPQRFISASDSNIRYMGRFDLSEKGKAVFMYSGSAISAGFTGTSVSVLLQDDSLRNWFTVKLDDRVFTFKAGKKDRVYPLAEHLEDKKHSLEINRRTEWHGGNTTFLGLRIDSNRNLFPLEKKNRLIEFIGDSYTCGYGNEGKSREEHFTYETENSYATYAAITARAFDAAYLMICRSGIGMYQSYGGNKDFTQPKLYDEVVSGSKARWDYLRGRPQVVVIELGANDLSVSLDSAKFVNTYISFVKKIRLQYPEVKIVCTAGPSGEGDKWIKFQSHIRAVTNSFKNADKNIYFFKYTPFDPNGSDWHPNLQEHQKMAAELIPFLKNITSW